MLSCSAFKSQPPIAYNLQRLLKQQVDKPPKHSLTCFFALTLEFLVSISACVFRAAAITGTRAARSLQAVKTLHALLCRTALCLSATASLPLQSVSCTAGALAVAAAAPAPCAAAAPAVCLAALLAACAAAASAGWLLRITPSSNTCAGSTGSCAPCLHDLIVRATLLF